MKKKSNSFISIYILTAALLLSALTSCKDTKQTAAFEAMNTFMTLQSYGKNAAKANDEIKNEISALEKRISTTISNSEIYSINHSNGDYCTVSKETADIIAFAKNIAETTDGALNPALYPIIKEWGFTTGNYKVPDTQIIKNLIPFTNYKNINVDGNKIKIEENMMLDLGAIGKGYAGDKAISILKENKIKSALMDFGGNIQALGYKPDGTEWKIGIKDPLGGNPIAVLRIHDMAVITSGGYERFFTADDKTYIHIFDGKTGYPVENDLLSTTIICEKGIYGDSLSTALFVMGSENAIDFWKTHKDFNMILITRDNKIIYTNPIKEKINLLKDFDSVVIIQD